MLREATPPRVISPFILAELEQMTAQEVAEATNTNVRTVYSRLRVARQQFEQAVARHP